MSQALRKLAGSLSKSNTTCIFINQLREKIGVMFGSPETTSGGRALKFFSTVRIDVRRIDSIKQGTEIVGNRVRAKVVKNKVAPPFRMAEFDLMYGTGISKEGSILDLGVEEGIVAKSGAWYTYGEERLGQGREAAKDFLRENPELRDEIENRGPRRPRPARVGGVVDAERAGLRWPPPPSSAGVPRARTHRDRRAGSPARRSCSGRGREPRLTAAAVVRRSGSRRAWRSIRDELAEHLGRAEVELRSRAGAAPPRLPRALEPRARQALHDDGYPARRRDRGSSRLRELGLVDDERFAALVGTLTRERATARGASARSCGDKGIDRGDRRRGPLGPADAPDAAAEVERRAAASGARLRDPTGARPRASQARSAAASSAHRARGARARRRATNDRPSPVVAADPSR